MALNTSPEPAIAADGILAGQQQTRYIVSLIYHALTIIRPSGRQHVLAHALAIQKHLVRAQCR